MTPSKDISRLIEIMVALRDPKTGCAWDAQQDFASIAPYTIEEAYEVLDAIQRDDMQDLRDELGDLLLQVVFHARMAEEAGEFDFGDVVEAITSKMVRRHPHVFGDTEAREAGMAKGMWDRIKAEEKAERRARRGVEEQGFLDEVPTALPALMHALKLQKKASQVGFDWGAAKPTLDKIEEEIDEVRQAMEDGEDKAVAEEFGDLVFAVVNLGRHLGVDAEAALQQTNDKFRRRFGAVERGLEAEGKTLGDASLDEMETHWQRAKSAK